MKNLVIIPARGNSKRLPDKNLRKLNGKTLLEHSIGYARKNSAIVSEIIISTDCQAIKEEGLKFGVKVLDRPADISGDYATTVSALKHVISELKEAYDNIILLQPTNPLRPLYLLKEAYTIYKDGDYDSLMTVSRNAHKLGKIENQKFVPYNYEPGQRSQDLEPLYFENGLLYITKSHIISNGQITAELNYPFVVNHPFGNVDIDNKGDLLLAEYYLKTYTNEQTSF